MPLVLRRPEMGGGVSSVQIARALSKGPCIWLRGLSPHTCGDEVDPLAHHPLHPQYSTFSFTGSTKLILSTHLRSHTVGATVPPFIWNTPGSAASAKGPLEERLGNLPRTAIGGAQVLERSTAQCPWGAHRPPLCSATKLAPGRLFCSARWSQHPFVLGMVARPTKTQHNPPSFPCCRGYLNRPAAISDALHYPATA